MFTAVLTGSAALELYFALAPPDRAPAAPTGSPQIGALAEPPAAAISAWRAQALSRPLFNPSRRPDPASQTPVISMAVPRLSGIMITPTERMAVLSPGRGGPVIVAANSQFGPFTVLSITADRVTVKGPDGVIVLRSDFSYHRQSAQSTPATTVLPGAIDLNLIRVPLPSAATWIGPPMTN
jgi:hypothetical protein